MLIGTALGWGNVAIIILAIALAFAFAYSLTLLPILRSGTASRRAAMQLALLSDTVSNTTIEIVDNLIMIIIAGAAAFPINRRLIARGRGHAVVHQYH